jgi:hypothetical protein
MRPRHRVVFACFGLLVLSVLYCLPGHPSAGRAVWLDGALHVALFAGIGLAAGALMRRHWWPLAALAILAELLEVLQWWFGGYAQIEVSDILGNEAGLVLAGVLLWRWRRRAD